MVALLIASYPDSIVKFRGSLIEALSEEGCAVHLACVDLAKSESLPSRWRELGVRAHDVPLQRTGTNPVADIRFLCSLVRLMRRHRPEFTLPYTIKPVIYGTLAAWLVRVPRRYALITGLGYAFTGSGRGPVKRLVSMLYRFALGRAHKVFFQNPDDERLFRTLGILPAHVPSFVVNGSGVDVAEYAPVQLPAGAPVFLMIGRLLGDKGVREYAQAAKEIRAMHPEVRCLLVGWIDANPDSIAQSELSAWVEGGVLEFLGKLDDVRPALASATIYVLPSYREGTPRTVLEAMAMGRAIITTDAPGCRETVIDGGNGYLVPVKSVDALVTAMQRFIDDSSLAARMGKCSREIAQEKYDVHKINSVMLREMGIGQSSREQGTSNEF